MNGFKTLRFGLIFIVLLISLNSTLARAVDPKVVFVKGKTTFYVGGATELGGFYDQYRGSLSYGKVTVVRPKGATLTKKMISAAQAACLKLWSVNKPGAQPAFMIFDKLDTVKRRLSVMGGPFIMGGNGQWIGRGFNSNDPTRKILAQGGFWDDLFNFRKTQALTTFKVGKVKIQAECDGNISAMTDYPL